MLGLQTGVVPCSDWGYWPNLQWHLTTGQTSLSLACKWLLWGWPQLMFALTLCSCCGFEFSQAVSSLLSSPCCSRADTCVQPSLPVPIMSLASPLVPRQVSPLARDSGADPAPVNVNGRSLWLDRKQCWAYTECWQSSGFPRIAVQGPRNAETESSVETKVPAGPGCGVVNPLMHGALPLHNGFCPSRQSGPSVRVPLGS